MKIHLQLIALLGTWLNWSHCKETVIIHVPVIFLFGGGGGIVMK